MLRIHLVRNPETWDGRIREGERITYEQIRYEEWEAIFFTVIMGYCPMYEYYVEGQNLDERDERARLRFQQAIPDYPLLGRMWDVYVDAIYKPEEVSQLRKECMRVQAMTDNAEALRGLGKLIKYTEEAERSGLGLFLACD